MTLQRAGFRNRRSVFARKPHPFNMAAMARALTAVMAMNSRNCCDVDQRFFVAPMVKWVKKFINQTVMTLRVQYVRAEGPTGIDVAPNPSTRDQ